LAHNLTQAFWPTRCGFHCSAAYRLLLLLLPPQGAAKRRSRGSESNGFVLDRGIEVEFGGGVAVFVSAAGCAKWFDISSVLAAHSHSHSRDEMK